MSNDFYTKSGTPATSSQGSSSGMRGEFTLVEQAFDKLPTLSGNGDKAIFVNTSGTAVVAQTAAQARTLLGVAIGTNVQAYDATLQSLSALGTAADKVAYTTATDTWAETPLTAAGRALIDDASASAQRTTLGLGTAATATIGTSGATVPMCDTSNTFSASNNFTTGQVWNNDVAVQAKQTGGTVINTIYIDASNITRIATGGAGLRIWNSTYATDLVKLSETGGLQLGAPTGGDKGAASINVSGGLYEAGVRVPQFTSGTWTPSLGGSTTYTTQEGTYSKIDRLVFARGQIVINSIGTGSTYSISGFPFVANKPSGGNVSYFWDVATSIVSLGLHILASGSSASILSLTAANTYNGNWAIFKNGTAIDFSIVYTTDS